MYVLCNFEDLPTVRIYRAYQFWRLLSQLGFLNHPSGNSVLCSHDGTKPIFSRICHVSQVDCRSGVLYVLIRHSRHCCLAKPEPTAPGRPKAAESLESCVLYTGTPRAESRPQVLGMSLCTGSLHPIKHRLWEVSGCHTHSGVKLISAHYFPESGQTAVAFLDMNLASKSVCSSFSIHSAALRETW